MRRVQLLACLILLSMILVLVGCSHKPSKSVSKDDVLNQIVADAAAELAALHDADLEWPLKIGNSAHSLVLERALVDTSRPVVLPVYLDDVYKEQNNYYARFVHDEFFMDTPVIQVTSQITEDDAGHLAGIPLDGTRSGFLVVARITEVRKAQVRLDATPGSGEAWVEVDLPTLFRAQGSLIAWRFFPDFPFFLDWSSLIGEE